MAFVTAGAINQVSIRIVATLSAALLLSACAGGPSHDLLSASTASAVATNPQDAAKDSAKAYAANRKDLDAALTHARNLKALGLKTEALAVLQQAASYHATDRRLASEYGRLALDLDQVAVAKRLLEFADDPANPDWRIISARGTVSAKSGDYKGAIEFLEKARALAPAEPSVLNNLALAHTLNGDAVTGEEILRSAAYDAKAVPKLRQNYALLLGLQGRYDDSSKVASRDLSADAAAANTEYLRRMVKHDPVTTPAVPGSWTPVATEPPAQVLRTVLPQSPATAGWSAAVDTTGSITAE